MSQYSYFVVLAEMRTGSNLLEENLNQFEGIACVGEAFNAHFIGYPKYDSLLGITKPERDHDPLDLIDAVREQDELTGFRFFHDHDLRAFEHFMPDPRCAKIVLTRNPIDSFVSWKIAKETGQWKLTNVKHARASQIAFDADEFRAYLQELQAFQLTIQERLQKTGQTAFYIGYDDLNDLDVINGLGAFLGAGGQIESLTKKLKKQNPAPLSEKVENYAEMEAALSGIDVFNLNRTPNFEPRRGGAVPTYHACARTPLLFMPIMSGPEAPILQWMADIEGCYPNELMTDFSQKTFKLWLSDHPGHRAFTVLRHPVVRAHAAFYNRIMSVGPGSYKAIRNSLIRDFKLPLPKKLPDNSYTHEQHREAFMGFLRFVKANLNMQTAIRIDANWASQTAVLQGFSNMMMPDLILREDELQTGLTTLAGSVAVSDMPAFIPEPEAHMDRLHEIYDPEIEAAVREIYARDYLNFGFSEWKSEGH